MPSPRRAPIVTLSPYTQATLALSQPRPLTSVDVPSLRAQLNTLDTALSTLLDQRLAVSQRLTEAVALSSPIRRLSTELLAEIFITSTIISDSPHDAPALLSTIMLVCKHWRDICFCTPDLWTRISISPTEPDSLEKARRRLIRAKGVPLDIFLDFSPRSSFSAQSQIPSINPHPQAHSFTPDHLLKTALLLLRPTISRWRTFVLLIPYRPQATAALALCSSPAPRLESLKVQVSNPMLHASALEWGGRRPVLPFAGITPRLRECSLTSFWFERPNEPPQTSEGSGLETMGIAPRVCNPPGFGIVSGMDSTAESTTRSRMVFLGVGPALVKLRLVGFWNEFAPNVEQMIAVLRQCTSLEELSLRNMTDVESAEVDLDSPSPVPVILSRLRHLSFYYSGVTRTCALLHCIVLPALERLELSFLDNITGCLKHLKQQALPHLGWNSHRQGYSFSHGYSHTRAREQEDMTDFPLKSLRIEASLFNELKLMRLLRRLPTLEKLEFIDVEDVSSNFLKGLSLPLQPNEWVLPRLETLNLEGCTSVEWDALKALIESRLPSSSASSSAAAALRHRGSISSSSYGFIRGATSVSSSASEYARGQAMAETPFTHTTLSLTPMERPFYAPSKIAKLDITRCNQISRERIQWLRMYVPNVVCEGGKGGWAGVDAL